METTKTRNVELWVHTTSGIEFEIIDVKTKESLTGGRVFWCTDEEAEWRDADGVDYFSKKIKEKGWVLEGIAWS